MMIDLHKGYGLKIERVACDNAEIWLFYQLNKCFNAFRSDNLIRVVIRSSTV